ncbi:kinase-like domain-containing protein [Podospora fimiseda]|uniref:Kinase-like domain-containing protein n=1 Tax=Podospora fimiseda TaxID=252190 RepID=A0AAN6YPP9_9PEZI|nr:kinase-like domain-containing protein [Podospora fimiseda]
MDHFRLLSQASTEQEHKKNPQGICRGRLYIRTVIDCAYPPISATLEDLFDRVEKRGEKMFFSQKQLKEKFNDQVVYRLLKCPCDQCVEARGASVPAHLRDDVRKKHAWLLFPVMVYLGKLHFVYSWLSAIEPANVNNETRSHAPVHRDQIANWETLIPHEIERLLFPSAYERVLRMFNPFVFQLSGDNDPVRTNDLVPYARFPYDAEKTLVETQSVKVIYFEVPAEYVHQSVRNRMLLYPSSIKDCVVDGKPIYRFVRKALKLSASNDRAEPHVLSLVSQMKKEVTENIITLLALYTWRRHIHYVFPFVESDLHLVLREGHYNDDIPSSALPLPDQWLWDQMIGVTRALKAIHFGFRNPFPEDPGRLITFHFDLRPKNILVTEDRKLKITDFGQSVMRIVDEGEALSDQFTSGDMKYYAPEAWENVHELGKMLRDPQGHLRQKEVLLNYDVWSLACIMLEVLIFLLEDRSAALERFDEKRKAEQYVISFFGTENVKQCVLDKISSLLQRFTNLKPVKDDIHDAYLHRVCTLLVDMFTYKKDERIYSSEVLNRLVDAGVEYQAAREKEGSRLRTTILTKALDNVDNGSFKEIGWRDTDDNTLSFLDM